MTALHRLQHAPTSTQPPGQGQEQAQRQGPKELLGLGNVTESVSETDTAAVRETGAEAGRGSGVDTGAGTGAGPVAGQVWI